MGQPLNSFSKPSLAVTIACAAAIWMSATDAEALNVHAVYRTACSRELGVILKVEKRSIQLLKLDGTIVKVPRHEIVSLAYYPVSQLPLEKLPRRPKVAALRIETLLDDEIVPLATGWPVDYSETKIAFLLDSGKDMVVDKDSIWSLEFVATLDPPKRRNAPEPIEFAHPQTAGFCAQETTGSAARKVFAQQLLNDRVVIKRELDRLQEGYEEVLEFSQDQKFYPVPHVYRDRTALGLWVSALSRYGGSETRTNNFTPMLVDELHLGPFRYQHIFLSGATPNQALLHNEAQAQLYYRFKAAYFHASIFFDPNIVLVGEKYRWRASDLEDEDRDDRFNEIIAIEFGFDYGPLALELTPAVAAQSVVKGPGFFEATSELNLWRVGLRLRQRTWEAQLFGGFANVDGFASDEQEMDFVGDSRWEYLYGRANVSFSPHPRVGAIVSAVYRKLSYRIDTFGAGDLTYDSTSVSTAIQGWFALSHRFNVGGNAILEIQSREATGDTQSKRRLFPKLALFTSFSF